MISKLEICNADHPIDSWRSNIDYKIDNLELSLLLFMDCSLASVISSKEYTKQLLLKKSSEFKSGRVPLYVCECCENLGCGAFTVKVEKMENFIVWSEFGYEGANSEGISQSEFAQKGGPFYFNVEQYKSALSQYL